MTIETIRKIGFPYGDFTVFLAKKNSKRFYIVKRDNIVVFKTKDSTRRSRKKAFEKAIELDKKNRGVRI